MQIVHPISVSIQQYQEEISDSNRYRPSSCPQCQAQCPLIAHGFYHRTLVEVAFDGTIRVRRYLCRLCRRTVSLLPDFALPYLRFGVSLLGLLLMARLLQGHTWREAARAASQPTMPYQRGQFWVRRFRQQAESLGVALAAWTEVKPAPNFLIRTLRMLASMGWIRAHHQLFSHLRMHLLGWPSFLAPHGRRLHLSAASLSSRA